MKYKHLLLAAASGALLFSGNAAAQSVNNYGCGTDEHNAYLEKMNPQSAQIRQAVEQFTQQYIQSHKNSKISAPLLKIPVVVHILTLNGMNGMSKAQVLNGIQILREDFRRTNADAVNTRPVFQPHAADFEIDFELAKIDPNGNPTEGINRVSTFTSNSTLSAYPISREEVKKAAPAWPTNKYFNIWLIEAWDNSGFGSGALLGYAQFPGVGPWNTYGLVMLGSQWGKIGAVPGTTATTDGRTATHEVGHNLNLYHTFQGGCGSSSPNHAQQGDGCGDTPPQAFDSQACNLNQNTCQNDHLGTNTPYTQNMPDQIENYMSYDQCQNMFTNDQKLRSRAAFAAHSQLQNLVSPANAIATGVDPNVVVGPLLPRAYFAGSKTRVCAGSSVTFTDLSYNGPAATAWNWSFPGGTPSSSTDKNPVITYATPGRYSVTFTAINSNGPSQPVTETNYITVTPVTGLPTVAPGIEYVESFEDPAFPANVTPNRSLERTTTSFDAGTPNWEQTLSAATEGSYSLRLRNNSIAVTGTKSILITPNINVSTVPSGTLRVSYDVAYAMKDPSSNDELRFYFSNDCGQTWNLRKSLSGASLVSNGAGNYVPGNFNPSSNQWQTVSVINVNSFSSGHLMFKIEGVSKNGNNSLYLDNFRVWTTAPVTGVGVNEDLAAKNNIKVYPNPVTLRTGVSFDLNKSEKVAVKIFDLVGNIIYEGPTATLQAGSHNISISDKMKNVSAGMYMLQLTLGNETFNTKLVSE